MRGEALVCREIQYASCGGKSKTVKFPGIPVLHKSTIQQLVKKVCKTLSDKKINRRRTVLTEEKLDDIAFILENSPNKSLSKLVQQASVSVSSVYKATKLTLNLKPYKFAFSAPVMVKRVEVPAKGNPANSPFPRHVSVRFSSNRCVLMVSNGLIRKVLVSQPLAATPITPVIKIVSMFI
ncbi:hypothetical protein C0J52_09249 [Blattella germanica]|nr:hypothetical protein C0J52_09249 [Blattella germanica]